MRSYTITFLMILLLSALTSAVPAPAFIDRRFELAEQNSPQSFVETLADLTKRAQKLYPRRKSGGGSRSSSDATVNKAAGLSAAMVAGVAAAALAL